MRTIERIMSNKHRNTPRYRNRPESRPDGISRTSDGSRIGYARRVESAIESGPERFRELVEEGIDFLSGKGPNGGSVSGHWRPEAVGEAAIECLEEALLLDHVAFESDPRACRALLEAYMIANYDSSVLSEAVNRARNACDIRAKNAIAERVEFALWKPAGKSGPSGATNPDIARTEKESSFTLEEVIRIANGVPDQHRGVSARVESAPYLGSLDAIIASLNAPRAPKE